jgi:hypothetical protein
VKVTASVAASTVLIAEYLYKILISTARWVVVTKVSKLLSIGQFLMTMAILFIVVSSTYNIDIWLWVGVTSLVLFIAAVIGLFIVAGLQFCRH